MKEPKTIADAQQLTLEKIKECMKRPHKERENLWYRTRWPKQREDKRFCAFCIVANCTRGDGCPAREACDYFCGNARFRIDRLRKLYEMVEEIEA